MSETPLPSASLERVEYVRHMFDAYKHAMRTLAASYRSVPERRSAIQIRDEFEGGIEGHVGTLLEALAAQREHRAILLAVLRDITNAKDIVQLEKAIQQARAALSASPDGAR